MFEDFDEDEEQTVAAEASLERTIDRMVAFQVEGRTYALPIDRVQEIQQLVEVTELPDTRAALVGLVNMRGEVIPAIDFRLLVGLGQRAYSIETPMIICRTGEALVALIVDEVEDVLVIPDDSLQAPSRMYALAEAMIGMVRLDAELVFLLDIEALIPSADVMALGLRAGGGGSR